MAALTLQGTNIQKRAGSCNLDISTLAARIPHFYSYNSLNILLLVWLLNSRLESPGVCIDLESCHLLYEECCMKIMEMKVKNLKKKHEILLSSCNRLSSSPLPLEQTSSSRSLPYHFFIKRESISLLRTYFEKDYPAKPITQ